MDKIRHWLSEKVEDFWLTMLVRSGNKLYGTVSLYCPDDENVIAVHFAENEGVLLRSCKKMLEEEDQRGEPTSG